MQTLHFSYEMEINYSVNVERCNFTIKCIPKNTKRQVITNLRLSLEPPAKYTYGLDGFRNQQIYGEISEPHDYFIYRIEGDATTGLSLYDEETNEDLDMIFSVPYGMNVPGENIKKFYQEHEPDKSLGPYLKAIHLMHELNKYMTYAPCSTTMFTTAEEAFSQGCGVCQDYAHILIALLHLADIPARYVTGLIVGEGASHAWVEILVNGKWYGIDPTNNNLVSDEHIKIGVGRDAGDCQINRGIMRGGGLHTQSIQVSVQKEKEE